MKHLNERLTGRVLTGADLKLQQTGSKVQWENSKDDGLASLAVVTLFKSK